MGSELPETWSNAEEIRTELSRALWRMSVFLILDDVWKPSHLEELMIADSNSKSRILLTTRNQNVVRQVDGNCRMFGMDLLNEN